MINYNYCGKGYCVVKKDACYDQYNCELNKSELCPFVEVPPQGKWLTVEYNDGSVRTECSVCGYGKDLPPVRHYCPNCGVKMERS